jgi:hypothetical protein
VSGEVFVWFIVQKNDFNKPLHTAALRKVKEIYNSLDDKTSLTHAPLMNYGDLQTSLSEGKRLEELLLAQLRDDAVTPQAS